MIVVSPEEPDKNRAIDPATKTFKKTLFDAGIPFTSFAVDDIEKEYERMKKRGVTFNMVPTKMDPVSVAVFDDTCGNLIQLVQQ